MTSSRITALGKNRPRGQKRLRGRSYVMPSLAGKPAARKNGARDSSGRDMNNNDVTQLIDAVSRGEDGASDRLLPLVYEELRVLARARMRHEQPGQTLQPTALVHEAYLRLVGNDAARWDGRRHFFAAAAEAMRRIMIERARRYQAEKHGGQLRRTGLNTAAAPYSDDIEKLVAWDDLLDRLAERSPEMADVVKLRYFAGFTVEDAAAALDISPRSVDRHWAAARAWLRLQFDRSEDCDG